MNIDGKVIVITGAARGIGQEYARYLGGLGARIVAADINDCSSTLDLVKAESGTAVGAKLDVASAASAMDVARAAVDAFGRIDALINNAALYGALKGGRFDTIKMNQAIPRNLESADLVGTVHWLVSDASRLVTGQTIAVDGGTVMH